MAQLLRVFISSPGDVVPERRRAALVIEKLAKDYARFFEIKPCLWESEPMLASGHFQDAIVSPSETDIVVLVLWARLGSPLPEAKYRGIDGRAPVTGTEWEFETALAAHRQRGIPDLLAYKKDAPPKAEYKSEADLEELRRQWQKLTAFWSRYFVDQDEFRAAFGHFTDLDGFEAKLESDLRHLIERRIAALEGGPDKPTAPTWLKGSPFRGLKIYRYEHAPIFFGRSEASKSAVEQLVENAEGGKPFLLVLGASGAGKSSLAQAGIVPALGVRGVVPGVGVFRRAVMRPGGSGGPFMALAAALTSDDALPELLNGQDAAALARHLEAAASDPAFPVVSALSARVQAARQKGDVLAHEDVRLVLVVDQFEELFTLAEVTPELRKVFVLCLKGLMARGHVFIVATMRSDYWHRAAEVPLLVALAEGRGRIDLLPPTQAEIATMISRPAEAAGLSFETDPRSDIGLDAALAEEAAQQPGALPLLSFLLDALYAEDVQAAKGSILRYASMRKLGGFQGAIATRAEAAFAALPADAQAALPKVLRALVTVSRSGAEPAARAVPMERFARRSAERRVVEAFLDPQVRLLVADGDGSGARVRLAHEALITHWDRAKRQIAQDRDDLRTRAMVEEALAEWQAAKPAEKRDYFLRDPQLANAVDLARRWAGDFASEALSFIEASLRRARTQQRMAIAASVVFALIAMTATVLGVLAYKSGRDADTQRDIARLQGIEAVAARSAAEKDRAAAKRETARANEQRASAERNFEVALKGAERVITSWRDAQHSRGVPAEIVTQINQSARQILEDLAEIAPDNLNLQVTRQENLSRLADSYQAQGKSSEAVEAAEESLAIARKIAAHNPNSIPFQEQLFSGLQVVGEIKKLVDDFAGALVAFEEMLTVGRMLAAAHANETALLQWVSVALNKVGGVHIRQREAAKAVASYEEAVAILRGFASKGAAGQKLLVDALLSLADAQMAGGDLQRAFAGHDEALAITRSIATSDLSDEFRQHDLGDLLAKLAERRQYVGGAIPAQAFRRTEALTYYNESLAIARKLAAAAPADGKRQRQVATILESIAELRRQTKQPTEARAAYEEVLEILRRTTLANPREDEWHVELAALLADKIAPMRRAANDRPGGFVAFEEALTIIRSRAVAIPSNAKYQGGVASTLERAADAYASDKDWRRALALYGEAVTITRRLAAVAHGGFEQQRDLVRVLGRLAMALQSSGDLKGAVTAQLESVSILRTLAGPDSGIGWRNDLAVNLNEAGDMQKEAGDVAGALASYDESVAVRRGMVADEPRDGRWTRGLAISLDKQGDARKAGGEVATALQAYEESLDIRRKRAVADRDDVDAQTDLLYSLHRVGITYEPSRGRAALQEALDIVEALAREDRLTGEQEDWPQEIRDLIVKIDAERTRCGGACRDAGAKHLKARKAKPKYQSGRKNKSQK